MKENVVSVRYFSIEIVDKIKTYTAEQGLVKILWSSKDDLTLFIPQDARQESASIKFMIWRYPLCHGDAQWCLCHAAWLFMSSKPHARLLSRFKTILPILNPMVTSLSITVYGPKKDPLKSKSVPKRNAPAAEYGVAAHFPSGLTRKGSRAR